MPAVIPVVAAVAGAAISANGASKGGKAQITAARAAGLQEERANQQAQRVQQFNLDRTRSDSAPWVNAGEGALNQLAWKLGVNPTNRIDPNFTRTRDDFVADLQSSGRYDEIYGKRMDLKRTNTAGLNAEADRLFSAQQTRAQSQPQFQGEQEDFGSLQRDFTLADRDADPVYQSGLQFGLDEGTKAYERQNAASGGLLSGRTLKELARYTSDYGSTKAQGAYERFGTNQATKFNRLSALAGTGQQQVNQIGAAGQNFANQVGQNAIYTGGRMADRTIDAGNARASNYISQAQTFGNGLNSLANTWQQNNLLRQPQSGDPYKGSSNARYL